MTEHDEMNEHFRTSLRDAVEARAAREANWPAFHARLNAAVASRLDDLRRRASGAVSATAGATAAWWEYAARAAIAAVPLGVAAALLLFAFLRTSGGNANDAAPVVSYAAATSGRGDSARAAFESVLTGAAAPRAAMAALIPVPSAAFLADSSGGAK